MRTGIVVAGQQFCGRHGLRPGPRRDLPTFLPPVDLDIGGVRIDRRRRARPGCRPAGTRASIRSVTRATPASAADHCGSVIRRAGPAAVVEHSGATGAITCPATSAADGPDPPGGLAGRLRRSRPTSRFYHPPESPRQENRGGVTPTSSRVSAAPIASSKCVSPTYSRNRVSAWRATPLSLAFPEFPPFFLLTVSVGSRVRRDIRRMRSHVGDAA
jgi:hypothetical protein